LKYAGLQYGHQCFGGNELKYDKRPERECNMNKRTGKDQFKWGGSWRNSIYSTGDDCGEEEKVVEIDYSRCYEGCYTDQGKRALPTFIGDVGKTAGAAECFKKVKARGLKYAGLQYGHQCFGGNELKYQKRSDGECNMNKRVGSDRYKWGGSWRNSIYTTHPGCENGERPTPFDWTFGGIVKRVAINRYCTGYKKSNMGLRTVPACL
jgi:hypothetical protein